MNWLYAHLIGDFILQNDWMAIGKKRSSWICGVHVLIYILPFLFCGLSWRVLVVVAAEHFFQDRFDLVRWSMLGLGKSDFSAPPMAPWSVILMDQIYHILFIAFALSVIP